MTITHTFDGYLDVVRKRDDALSPDVHSMPRGDVRLTSTAHERLGGPAVEGAAEVKAVASQRARLAHCVRQTASCYYQRDVALRNDDVICSSSVTQ